jgi:hypothetical protein
MILYVDHIRYVIFRMMKSLKPLNHLVFSAFVLMFFSVNVVAADITDGWTPFCVDGKWGYKNAKKEVVIEAKLDYEYCQTFKDGLALVSKRSGYGYIDVSGKEVIPCSYIDASNFYQGRAVVQKELNGKWFFINRLGNAVFKNSFDNAWCYYDSIAIILRDTLYYFIDWNGQVKFGRGFDYIEQFQEGFAVAEEAGSERFTYINKSGEPQFGNTYKYATAFYNGTAWVHDGSQYVLIDSRGKVRNPFPYLPKVNSDRELKTSTWFNQGVCCVKDTVSDKYFFLNDQYQRVSPYYDFASPFDNQPYAIASDSTGDYYIDNTFRKVFDQVHLNADTWNPPFTWVQNVDTLWYALDENGAVRTRVGFRYYPEFTFGLALEVYDSLSNKNDTLRWFVNQKGEQVYGPYDWAYYFSKRVGWAPVEDLNEGYYFIDRLGNRYGSNEGWNAISTFSNGIAIVGKNHEQWYVDSTLTNVFGTKYNDATLFNDSGYAKVEKNYAWGLIDAQGKLVLEYQFPSEAACPETPYQAEELRKAGQEKLSAKLRQDSILNNDAYLTKRNSLKTLVETSPNSKLVVEYDGNGNVIKSTYFQDGRLYFVTVMTYNASGNISTKVVTSYNEYGQPYYVDGTTFQYEPDSTELLEWVILTVHAHHEIENGIWEYYTPDSTISLYNDRGLLSKEIKISKIYCDVTHQDSIRQVEVFTYAYDENGNLSIKLYELTTGCTSGYAEVTEYFFSKEGNKEMERTRIHSGNGEGKVLSVWKTEYDKKGQVITLTYEFPEGTTMTKYTYSPNQLIQSSTFRKDDEKVTTTTAYKYYRRGQLIDSLALYFPPPAVTPAVEKQRRDKRDAETLPAHSFVVEGGVMLMNANFHSKVSLDYYTSVPEYAAPLRTGQMGGGVGIYFMEGGYHPINKINRNMRVRRFDWGTTWGMEVGTIFHKMGYCKEFYDSTAAPLGYEVAEDLDGNYWQIGVKYGPNLSWRPSLKKKIYFEFGMTGRAMFRTGTTTAYGYEPGYDRSVKAQIDKGKFNRNTLCTEFYLAIRLGKFRIYGSYVNGFYDRSTYTETWEDNDQVVNTFHFTSNVDLSHFRFGLGANIPL